MDNLNPKTLGSLIALYEHKVFTQAHIWGINAFDQWGVQLGKLIGTKIYKTIADNEALHYDSSTNHLLSLTRKLSK
jgi:glucose-6-phosphate isomerase